MVVRLSWVSTSNARLPDCSDDNANLAKLLGEIIKGHPKAGAEAKFDLEPAVELVLVQGMKMADLNEAFDIAIEHREQFLAAWKQIHTDL